MKKKDMMYLKGDHEVRIFSDPYRMRIISAMRKIEPATVKQIADEMNETPAKVHYHMKKFISIEMVRLDHTKVINGIIAKYYVLTAHKFVIEADEEQEVSTVESALESALKAISDDYTKNFRVLYNKRMEAIEVDSTKEHDGLDEGEDDEKILTTISADTLYLEPKEALKFAKMAKDFIQTHGKKTNDKQKAYFVALAHIEQQGESNKK